MGFYDSLVVFDHHLAKTWIISTGLQADGSRSESKANEQVRFWQGQLRAHSEMPALHSCEASMIQSTFTREEFIAKVARAGIYPGG